MAFSFELCRCRNTGEEAVEYLRSLRGIVFALVCVPCASAVALDVASIADACIVVLLRMHLRQGGPLVPLARRRVHQDAQSVRPAPAAQVAFAAQLWP